MSACSTNRERRCRPILGGLVRLIKAHFKLHFLFTFQSPFLIQTSFHSHMHVINSNNIGSIINSYHKFYKFLVRKILTLATR
jgi:hypothetical protein